MEIKFINTEYEKELGEIIGLFFQRLKLKKIKTQLHLRP